MAEGSRRIGRWDGKYSKQSFVPSSILLTFSVPGRQEWDEGEVAGVVFLSAQTPVILSSIKLPVLAWKLLTTVRTSAPVWSCLSNSESWKESKKAKEPDRKGQREGGLPEEGDNQEQRALSAGSKHRAASQVLRTSPPQPPTASQPLFRDWQSTTANISLSSNLPPLKYKSSAQGCPTSVWTEFIRPSWEGEKAKCGNAVLSILCFPL